MNRMRLAAVAGTAIATLLLSGCSLFTSPRSIGIDDYTDVVTVELYEYEWGTEPDAVRKLTIHNNEIDSKSIKDWVDSYTDVPTTRAPGSAAAEMVGKEALAVRFTLDDGSTRAVTRIFIAYHDVVVIWEDGEVRHTKWGAPDLLDYYSEFMGELEEVNAEELPRAELP